MPKLGGCHNLLPRREALKEQELAEKKLARLEAARSTDITSLQSELDALKASARADVKSKDLEINRLVENLGNSEAMLNDKTQELEQVGKASSKTYRPQPSRMYLQRVDDDGNGLKSFLIEMLSSVSFLSCFLKLAK